MKTTVAGAAAEQKPRPLDSKSESQASPAVAPGLAPEINHILVPLDFSPTAMQALDYATALAQKENAQIHLLHVQMPDEASVVPGAGHLMRESAESATFLREKLSAGQQEGIPQFWPENCHIRTGRAYHEICELARESRADLIVLGSHGHTGLKRILLGSTAERVVRLAPCPVLVVRQRKRKGRPDEGLVKSKRKFTIRTILAPVDFSQCSMAGVMYAAFLAKAFDAKLWVFHTVHPPAPVLVDRVSANLASAEVNLADARLEMEAFLKLDFLQDVKCETEIRTGYPVDEICGAASRPDIDLIVTSTHGRTGINRMLLGSVAEHVVRYAECSVLVVPSR